MNSARVFYLLLGGIATALFALQAVVDHYRMRRRARRLRTGPTLSLPRQERTR